MLIDLANSACRIHTVFGGKDYGLVIDRVNTCYTSDITQRHDPCCRSAACEFDHLPQKTITPVQLPLLDIFVRFMSLLDRSRPAHDGRYAERSGKITGLRAIGDFRLGIAARPGFHARHHLMTGIDSERGIVIQTFEGYG